MGYKIMSNEALNDLQHRVDEKRILISQVTDLIASYGDYLPLSDLVENIKPIDLEQWIIDTGNHPRTWGAIQ